MGTELSRRDGEWLDLVADLLAAPLVRWPDTLVARQLVRTFEAAGCVSHVHDADGLSIVHYLPTPVFEPYLDELLPWTSDEAPARHPLLRYHLVTGQATCLQVADVPDGIADRRMQADWHARGRRWGGVQAQVSIPVQFTGGRFGSFVLGRTDPYTGQEMASLRRVQRLLAGLDRQIGLFVGWSAGAPADALDAAGTVHLTPREIVVVDLLSRSLTAAAIARRLNVAERTVQKHLQRIYRKLGASDRLGAVRRAECLGLVQPPVRTQFPTLPPG